MLGFLSGGTCGFTFRIPKTAAGETGILNNSQTNAILKNRRNKTTRIPISVPVNIWREDIPKI
jgi:hypothetical protein